MMGADFVMLSLVPLLIGACAALACALPGTFLILRKQALLGDAISHVVLPGIVLGFLVSGSVSAAPMLIGATGAALLAVVLIEALRRAGVEPGAAMGVVFTTLFAAGVLLLERSDTSAVHLDVEHALYGNLESLIWIDATGWASVLDWQALKGLPPELPRMAAALAVLTLLTGLFWRPLAISSFDEPFARAIGLPVAAIGLGLSFAATLAAVAAFDAVGAIIPIAMFICPPASARMMTDRLGAQVAWSLGFALLAAVLGFVLASALPLWLGHHSAVSAAGMIATVSGFLLALAALVGPNGRIRA